MEKNQTGRLDMFSACAELDARVCTVHALEEESEAFADLVFESFDRSAQRSSFDHPPAAHRFLNRFSVSKD